MFSGIHNYSSFVEDAGTQRGFGSRHMLWMARHATRLVTNFRYPSNLCTTFHANNNNQGWPPLEYQALGRSNLSLQHGATEGTST